MQNISNSLLNKESKTSGFTIVELLIVIVVIAILAAITIVTYNGIQDRATNASMQAAFTQVENLVRAYAVVNSTPPYIGRTCAIESGCNYGGAVPVNSTFRTNINTIGTHLPMCQCGLLRPMEVYCTNIPPAGLIMVS